MKKFLPFIVLIAMLLLTVSGTVWVVLTYPHKARVTEKKYNLSRKKVQELKNQILLFNRKEKFRESENLLRRIIADYPGNMLAETMLGKVKFLRGNYQESRLIFRKLSMLQPDDPLIRSNLGAVLTAGGLYENGIRELLAAEALSGGTKYIYINLCRVSILLGKLKQAQQYWEKAQQSSPSIPEEAILLMTTSGEKPQKEE